jgi:hypothetical protein
MTEAVITLAFELYLIACCLFAPGDKKEFEIELREGKQEQGIVMYVDRTASGFSIYGNKEKKGDAMTVRKDGERYILIQERGGKKEEHAIDNSKITITSLDKDGSYIKEIGTSKVIFERKQGIQKIYQKNNDKIFLVR